MLACCVVLLLLKILELKYGYLFLWCTLQFFVFYESNFTLTLATVKLVCCGLNVVLQYFPALEEPQIAKIMN